MEYPADVFSHSAARNRNYWVAKVTDDHYFEEAVALNCWLMQQRYGIQNNAAVSNTLKLAGKVRPGDILLLGYGSMLYAYGEVIPCRHDSGQVCSLAEVITHNKHDFFKGIVRFSDSEVFYEYLEKGCKNWGQRIDVDAWQDYNPSSSVSTSGISGAIAEGIPSLSIYRIKEPYALQKMEELKKQSLGECYDLVSLLEKNHNIVLTGAPGTGKTHLARQIAAQMTQRCVKIAPPNLLKRVISSYKPDPTRRQEDGRLLEQFQTAFPAGTLAGLPREKYCIGLGRQDTFCYWIEQALSDLGRFAPGRRGSSLYGIYFSKDDNTFKKSKALENSGDREAYNRLISEIAHTVQHPEDLGKAIGEKICDGGFLLKILHSYYPDNYMPVFSKEHIARILAIRGLESEERLRRQNLTTLSGKLYDFYQELRGGEDITTLEMMRLLYETLGIRDEPALVFTETVAAPECVEFVQFHPSYDYTDFVEGLRPTRENCFRRQDGIFKAFCKRALETEFETKLDHFLDEVGRNNSASDPLVLSTPKQGAAFSVYLNARGELHCDKGDASLTREMILRFYRGEPVTQGREPYYAGVVAYVSRRTDPPAQKYVFIIDEINRGEISKIFGELFFSIDPGYRGPKGRVRTQYQNLVPEDDPFAEGFYVPENVYIIGTMNDIDRSVESMDFAMRRRFLWEEITADHKKGMLDGHDWTQEAKRRMDNLNRAIEQVDGLSKAYHIGPAYFLKLEKLGDRSDRFGELWHYHLRGLLGEYLRGMDHADDVLAQLKAAYENSGDGDHR